MTRAEISARHTYRRELEKSVRALTKATAWKSVAGGIFREQADWFIEVRLDVHINEHVTKARIFVKPMAIDPIFWDVVGLSENREMPLSFRANGAWTCSSPCFAEAALREDGNPTIVANHMIAVANEQLEIALKSYSLDAFLSACLGPAEARGSYLASVVTTLIAMNRMEEALVACEQAQSRDFAGGFVAPAGTFVEMAAAWLRRSLVDATRH